MPMGMAGANRHTGLPLVAAASTMGSCLSALQRLHGVTHSPGRQGRAMSEDRRSQRRSVFPRY